MVNVFAVPGSEKVFFICFRECLETSIIVSVLLSFIKQTVGGPKSDPKVYKKLLWQIWLGVIVGLIVVLAIGGGMIGAFYGYGKNHFASAENLWEGIFSLIASIIITIMGAALLRVSKLQDKWRVKLAQALEKKNSDAPSKRRFKHFAEKYALFILPFITVLREGLEAVIFIGGVGLSQPATAFPLAVICGLIAGVVVGWFIYSGTRFAPLQIALIVSTCFLYLVAAGLFSKAVWFLEANDWAKIIGGDTDNIGSGPGSYDITKSVWHVNCCNPQYQGGGGWGIFNALFGWENSATYGSVISYNMYWIAVILCFLAMRYNEKKGHWPLMKPRHKTVVDNESGDSDSNQEETNVWEQKKDQSAQTSARVTAVRDH